VADHPAFDCGAAGLLAARARLGLEGIVANRTASFSYPGRRPPDWVKVKTGD
jgi:ATP-dependent DNA ligase